jgi:hypothetical protein
VSLEATNAAIVAAAQTINTTEADEERACQVAARADVDACIARARRWNAALEAYDAWRVAWAALQAAWNAPSPSAGDVAAAQAKLEGARAQFWIAKQLAETGGAK